jgi:hypothetical protein
LLAFPPVERGHAAAGDDPGLGARVGMTVAVGLGRAVAVGEADAVAVGESDREADGVGEATNRVSG